MTDDIILRQFDQLGTWSRGDQRAPHKPLLALYALGRWAAGDRGDIPFKDVDRDLTELLNPFIVQQIRDLNRELARVDARLSPARRSLYWHQGRCLPPGVTRPRAPCTKM
jgi:hypothetical protein